MQSLTKSISKGWKSLIIFIVMLFVSLPAISQLYPTGVALYSFSSDIPVLNLQLASITAPISDPLSASISVPERFSFSTSPMAVRFTNSYLAPTDSLPEGMPLRTRMFWGEKGLFRLIGLGPDSRRDELKLRRRMLQWHQRFGLATWASFTAQMVVGQLLLNGNSDLQGAHGVLAATTVLGYMTTASFSIFSPPARTYKTQAKSILTHRILALVHFAGMVAIPILGEQLTQGDGTNRESLENAHVWTARITYGAYTAALLTSYLSY